MKNNKQKKGDLGQHWTPPDTAQRMYDLCQNNGTVLEPTAGSGRFVSILAEHKRTFDAIEIDCSVVPDSLLHHYKIMNFFELGDKTYDTILGNPPYVAGKLLERTTLPSNAKLGAKAPIAAFAGWKGFSSDQANLYIHTLEKCVTDHTHNGSEIVFIIPATFISGTSRGSKLKKKMCDMGSFTHVLAPSTKWENADVDVVIIRWVRGANQGVVQTENGVRHLFERNGFIKLLRENATATLDDYFKISVGAASKAKLKTVPPQGQSFIKGRQLEWHDITDAKKNFPRWRITNEKHKVLVLPGPTRHLEPFYDTLQWSEKQAAYHFEYELVPKKDINNSQLSQIVDILNEWQANCGEELLLRNKGRWSVGINELKYCPIPDKTKRALERVFNV